ncbi:MxaC, protein involved in Ca2+ insertion into methanol dehydrogenase [Methylophaga frappieri]|uniref:MxaC, protein involved in Ca2+ insertion into methanol dehydrogenase n=1 Tax=Methylophaga frappieri (strain ATCC BAA-2434 / DSM 25690 / JAM7) TaxID=754477 RepID=I1YK11_METFJ|nr:vWA domain-containing protein [Methylophaga frappieri]AFJ03254.1 MxaC, protein involved in Ca2+ insertion into methanol dehydrogenase [Methylophaga frappieri]
MNLSLAYPWVAGLLLLAALPLMRSFFRKETVSWAPLLPAHQSSIRMRRLLQTLGVIAIISSVLGLAGLHQTEQTLLRTGNGAHIVFVLDRSGSMNETFGGNVPDETTPAKREIAHNLLSKFVDKRPHDLFGVVGFTTQPFFISPLTEHKSFTQAAIDSLQSPGLAFTNAAKGLGMGLRFFEDQPHTGSRVIVLVSDGAATLDHRAQRVLREWFERYQASLYWFFLRTENGLGINSTPDSSRDDNPRVMPERYLDKFFSSLPVKYRAYEIDTEASLQAAVDELDELENMPLTYEEQIPRRPLHTPLFILAFLCLAGLTVAKFLEHKP